MSKDSKKPVARKLDLGKKTIRRLTDEDAAKVAGGMPTVGKCLSGMLCCGGVPVYSDLC